MDEGRTDQLVFFAFDLLFLNGVSTAQLPLFERKERLQRLFKKEIGGLRYSEHVAGDGPALRAQACKLGLEGPISKQADRPYAPGDRGIWVKSNCLNGCWATTLTTAAALCWPCWHRHDGQGAEAPGRRAGAAPGGEDGKVPAAFGRDGEVFGPLADRCRSFGLPYAFPGTQHHPT